jgi:hypothetical protein
MLKFALLQGPAGKEVLLRSSRRDGMRISDAVRIYVWIPLARRTASAVHLRNWDGDLESRDFQTVLPPVSATSPRLDGTTC